MDITRQPWYPDLTPTEVRDLLREQKLMFPLITPEKIAADMKMKYLQGFSQADIVRETYRIYKRKPMGRRRPRVEDKEFWVTIVEYQKTRRNSIINAEMLVGKFLVTKPTAIKLLERIAKAFPESWRAERDKTVPWEDGPVICLRWIGGQRETDADDFQVLKEDVGGSSVVVDFRSRSSSRSRPGR